GALFRAHHRAVPRGAGAGGIVRHARRPPLDSGCGSDNTYYATVLLLPVVLRPERQSAGAVADRAGRDADRPVDVRRIRAAVAGAAHLASESWSGSGLTGARAARCGDPGAPANQRVRAV